MLLLSLPTRQVAGQLPQPGKDHIDWSPSIPVNDALHPCISHEEYAGIEEESTKNRKRLGLDKVAGRETATSLQWPLRPAAGQQDCGYYFVSAFVDLNAAGGQIRDWNCGTRTYDGHRGNDIVAWPFIWDKMDRNYTEVVAAAAGTIIAKADGNFDRVCNPTGTEPLNYIHIQHADGSTALYAHLKRGSLTAKSVGQTVAAGELLATIGSSGVSNGAHLHFEVRSDGNFNNYLDPALGACNTGIGASWWAAQKPYVEPEIMKLSLHSYWPYFASCPNTTDTTYEVNSFVSTPGAQAVFHAASKHVLTGDTWNFRIINPDNSTFDSWNFTSASNRNTSTLGFSRNLPVAPGTYTFEGRFNNITCTKTFTVQLAVGVGDINYSNAIRLFPNPSGGKLFLKTENRVLIRERPELSFYNSSGQMIKKIYLAAETTETDLQGAAGIYLYRISSAAGKTLRSGFLVLQ